jgi:5-methylcytosine-specific restriction enzyme subunit McrC
MQSSQRVENKNLLSDILFILDDVSDTRVTYLDCEKVHLNPLYEDLSVVLDYCKLFLSNSVTYSYKNQFQVFAFLLPMEYIFEDFILGFIERHFKKIDGIANLMGQKSDLFLASLYENDVLVKNQVFNLKHDIYFEYKGKKIIADTKYKIIYSTNQANQNYDFKHGVSQNDLYQLASYAIRRKADQLYLIYPETISDKNEGAITPTVKFMIHDEFAEKDISIYIGFVPIIHSNFPEIDNTLDLQNNFLTTEKLLIDTFTQIFQFNSP